jgi:hypothetical protein
MLGGLVLAMGTAPLRVSFPGESAARESRRLYQQLARESAAQRKKTPGKRGNKKR